MRRESKQLSLTNLNKKNVKIETIKRNSPF